MTPLRFTGNRLAPEGDDRFGFHAVATRIADAISDQVGPDCLVIGVEAPWGSGKSKLLDMLGGLLKQRSTSVVEFNPWLVGSRDALLADLFAALETAVADQEYAEGDATRRSMIAVRAAAEQLRRYAARLTPIGEIAAAAAALHSPYLAGIAKFLKHIGKAGARSKDDTSLVKVKKKTVATLKALGQRFVVMIDDLDRLQPHEAVEVLRLVQSVADFPNIVYVLAYDPARLAESVQSVTKLVSGAAYIEKIVQLPVVVPWPQPGDLRRMFRDGLSQIVGTASVEDRAVDELTRTHVGPRLRTPRSIERALDRLRFVWPGVKGEIYLPDLIWLQFVRVENEGIYRWIEEYTAEVALLGAVEKARGDTRHRMAKELKKLLETEGVIEWPELRERLPRVAASSNTKPDEALFDVVDGKAALEAYRSASLRSPDHSRLYFGMLRPEGALSDEDMSNFVLKAVDPEALSVRLLELVAVRSRAGASHLAIIVDQIAASPIALLQGDAAEGFVRCVLRTGDNLLAAEKWSDKRDLQRKLSKIVASIAERLAGTWANLLESALQTASAVDFLTLEVKIKNDNVEEVWDPDTHSLVLAYLKERYSEQTPADFMESLTFAAREHVWEVIDPPAYARFIEAVREDDDFFALYLIRNHGKRSSDGKDDTMRRLFLSAAVNRMGGPASVVERLSPMLQGADAKITTPLREIVNLLHES